MEKAFIEVASMLLPFVTWHEIEKNQISFITDLTTKTLTTKTKCIEITLRGYSNENDCLVKVYTENNPTKGKQIVIENYDAEGNIIMKRNIWYYAFNWEGICHRGDFDLSTLKML